MASDALGNNDPLERDDPAIGTHRALARLGKSIDAHRADGQTPLMLAGQRQHGAHAPPYEMRTREMMQAIRDGHEATRDQEFLGEVMEMGEAKLLDLYLDADICPVCRRMRALPTQGLPHWHASCWRTDSTRTDRSGLERRICTAVPRTEIDLLQQVLIAGVDIDARRPRVQENVAGSGRPPRIMVRRGGPAQTGGAQTTDGRVPLESRRRDQPAR